MSECIDSPACRSLLKKPISLLPCPEYEVASRVAGGRGKSGREESQKLI